MVVSAARFALTVTLTVCSTTAVVGLILLVSGSQGSHPGARSAADRAGSVRTVALARADIADHPQRDEFEAVRMPGKLNDAKAEVSVDPPHARQPVSHDSPAESPAFSCTQTDCAENARTNDASQADSTRRRPRDATPDLGIATLNNNVRRSRPHNSRFDRFEAISELGESNEGIAERTLIDLLHDQDPAIRESALESLAHLATDGAIQGLGFALTDSNPLVRRSAIELLAQIGTPDALAALTATLIDPDVDLRLTAVYELADAESEAAARLLQQFLSDANPAVRNAAAGSPND